MPIPKPYDKEDEKKFMSRCMGDENMVKEYDGDQRAAICMKSFKSPKKNIEDNIKINQIKEYKFAVKNPIHRKEKLDGVDYTVVPVVLIKEGVHNGLFYPGDELKKFAAAWNGRPVPVQHPEIDGVSVSCNQPEFIEKNSVGQIFNTFYDEETKSLKAEAWINIEKANKVDPRVLTTIYQNGRMEVSTGLWHDTIDEQGTWNGEKYDAVLINYRPDHLALLPEEKGACSWEDGCGIRLNIQDFADWTKNNSDKLNKYKSVTFVRNDTFYGDIFQKIRKMLDEQMSDKMKKVMGEMGMSGESMPMPYVSLIDVSEDYCVYQNPDGVLMKQNYKMNEKGEITFEGDPIKVIEKREYIETNQKKEVKDGQEKGKEVKSNSNSNLTNNNGGNKKMITELRKAQVAAIIANTMMPFVAAHKDWLEGLEDAHFDKINDLSEKTKTCPECNPEVKANMEKQKKQEEERKKPKTAEEFISNAPIEMQEMLAEGLKMQRERKESYIKAILANKKNKFTETQLKAKGMDELEAIVALSEIIDTDLEFDFSGRGGAPIATNADKDGRYPDGTGVPKVPAMEWGKK